jgi:uncharacterized membrane protein
MKHFLHFLLLLIFGLWMLVAIVRFALAQPDAEIAFAIALLIIGLSDDMDRS